MGLEKWFVALLGMGGWMCGRVWLVCNLDLGDEIARCLYRISVRLRC